MLKHFLFRTTVAVALVMLTPALAQVDTSLNDRQFAGATTWKTIALGSFASPLALFGALDAAGVHVGDTAEEVLHRPAFNLSIVKTRVQLVVLSAADLGFDERVSLGALYDRARKVGYELCPPEVVAQLRLQYRDQPVGEVLNVAMEPIATFEGQLIGLSVANGGAGLMIVGEPRSRDSVRDRTARFVFVRPRQIAGPLP